MLGLHISTQACDGKDETELAMITPTYTRIYQIQDIYRSATVTAPTGWNFVEFRVPRTGESYLNTVDPALVMTAHSSMDFGGEPRLIVEKIKRIQYTFKPTGEHRKLRKGEYYKLGCNKIRFAQYGSPHDSAYEWDIYKLVQEEI